MKSNGMASTGSISFARLLTRNIKRRSYRNIATILCFAFVAASILSARYLIIGTTNCLNVGISRIGADLIVVPANATAAAEETAILTGQPTTFFFNTNPVAEIMRIPGVAAVSPEVYIATLSASCCSLSSSTYRVQFQSRLHYYSLAANKPRRTFEAR